MTRARCARGTAKERYSSFLSLFASQFDAPYQATQAPRRLDADGQSALHSALLCPHNVSTRPKAESMRAQRNIRSALWHSRVRPRQCEHTVLIRHVSQESSNPVVSDIRSHVAHTTENGHGADHLLYPNPTPQLSNQSATPCALVLGLQRSPRPINIRPITARAALSTTRALSPTRASFIPTPTRVNLCPPPSPYSCPPSFTPPNTHTNIPSSIPRQLPPIRLLPRNSHNQMPQPTARQHAFSHDTSPHKSLYSALETAANLPSPPISSFKVSLLRKSRLANGINVGILYLTKSHLIFYAHFVTTSPSEQRLVLPFHRIQHVRRVRYSRLLPHTILIRCTASPDYLIALCSKDEQKNALSQIRSVLSDAKDLDSDDYFSDGEDDPALPDSAFTAKDSSTHSDPHPPSNLEHVKVATIRKPRTVKFAPTHYIVEEKKPPIKPSQEKPLDSVNPVETIMETALSKVQHAASKDRQLHSNLFCISAFTLLFTTIAIFVALHLLHLRMSIVANHFAAHH